MLRRISETLLGTPPEPDGSSRVASLLDRERTYLTAYLLAAVRNPQDTEDLLQEVSLIAVELSARYTPGTNFRAWVREIARYVLLRHKRRLGERPAAPLPPKLLEQLEQASEPDDAGEEVSIEQERRALDECLGSLSGVLRRVIDLRYVHGRAVPEIATAIGRAVGPTYDLLKRARQLLRDCTRKRLNIRTERNP